MINWSELCHANGEIYKGVLMQSDSDQDRGLAMVPDDSPRRRWLVVLSEYDGVTTYTGGVGRRYAAMLPALVTAGAEVRLLVIARDFLEDPPDPRGVLITRSSTPRWAKGPLLYIWIALRARSFARSIDHDIAYMPEWLGAGALLVRQRALVTNLVTSARKIDEIRAAKGPVSSGLRRRIARIVQSKFEDRQIHRSDGLIAISSAIADWNRQQFDHLPPIRVVRNCIDVAHVRQASQTAPLPSGWPVTSTMKIMFVGRLEARKGIEVALNAFKSFSDDFPEVRLVLVGGFGDSSNELGAHGVRALLGAKYAPRVDVLGDVVGDTIYRAMASADVVICPSLWEAFGNVALEAKAAGTALVVTSGSGFDDFCKDSFDCLKVPPGDSIKLARACVRLLTDSGLRERLQDNASAEVDNFSPLPVAADLISAVNDLIPIRST